MEKVGTTGLACEQARTCQPGTEKCQACLHQPGLGSLLTLELPSLCTHWGTDVPSQDLETGGVTSKEYFAHDTLCHNCLGSY